jgi:alpha 1,6-mannosyltransferase
VFLDAIGQSIKKSLSIAHEASLAAQTGEIYVPESALEWTGPGVFTDSVMRYLLVRYGFNPRQLLHVKDPIRVGDVL